MNAGEFEAIIGRFEDAWQAGKPPKLEEFLPAQIAGRREILAELVQIEWEYRFTAGETPTEHEYRRRFPELFIDTDLASRLSAAEQQLKQTISGAPAQHVRPTPCLQPGSTLGNYKILELLGQGAMGQVFKAEHRTMKRLVALKVIAPKPDWIGESLKRFRREIETVARLSHPNIVAAYDANEVEGMHYLAMELVDGVDLGRRVHDGGPLPVDLAVGYVAQAARGFEHAHRAGIVHRDIKPGNLMVNSKGVVKILDLGLASWRTTTGPANEPLTQTGQVFGTAEYMAPEQSQNAKAADARSDVYSLGCTLWFLLTGESIYSGGKNLMANVMAHRQRPIPSLRQANASISPALEAVFIRMVAKTPEARYQSMNDVATALESLVPRAKPAPGHAITRKQPRGPAPWAQKIRVLLALQPMRWALTAVGSMLAWAGFLVCWWAISHWKNSTPVVPATDKPPTAPSAQTSP